MTEEILNPATLTQLSGNALAVGVMGWMLHYFMKKEERRERQFEGREEKWTKVVRHNTQALHILADAILNPNSGLTNQEVRKAFNAVGSEEE